MVVGSRYSPGFVGQMIAPASVSVPVSTGPGRKVSSRNRRAFWRVRSMRRPASRKRKPLARVMLSAIIPLMAARLSIMSLRMFSAEIRLRVGRLA